jgi:hypothetical protein
MRFCMDCAGFVQKAGQNSKHGLWKCPLSWIRIKIRFFILSRVYFSGVESLP